MKISGYPQIRGQVERERATSVRAMFVQLSWDVAQFGHLAGNCFKGKWGTPDVLGVGKSAPGDIIRVPEEIVAGEVKVASSQALIEAFGQACSYKLFCHKSYIVVPKNSSKDDIVRLDALARIFGIGLVLFDSTNPAVPDFSIRVRAAAHSPDIFFVNEKMKIVEKELFT